jgi:hypothetical protein
LPLEFAICRGWGETIIKAIIKAYPAAVTTLDPVRLTKKFDANAWKPDSCKGCRWMRKIAIDHYAKRPDPAMQAVLLLLPRPTKVAPLAWTDGAKVEAEEDEKRRMREEKAAKKCAKLEKAALARAAKLEREAAMAAKHEARRAADEERNRTKLRKSPSEFIAGDAPATDKAPSEAGASFV